jgi:trimeric autotransporter adhesin
MHLNQDRDHGRLTGTQHGCVALLLAVTLGGISASPALAQCESAWLPGASAPGINNAVNASIVAPNGDLIIGGEFTTVGGRQAPGLAKWDGQRWSQIGNQIQTSLIASLAFASGGDLYVGGSVFFSPPLSSAGLARWNGTSWQGISTGGGSVTAILTLPNGEVVVGGNFTTIGGAACARIARWDGTQWRPLGTGINNLVQALAVLPGGDLIATGRFTTAGDVPVNAIARWDGTSWSAMGSGLTGVAGSTGLTMLTLPNGDVILGGSFAAVSGVPAQNLARFSNGTWSEFGGATGPVRSLTRKANGDIVVGGSFYSVGGVTTGPVARWDGATWQPLGTAPAGMINTLSELPDGSIFAGGRISAVTSTTTDNAARFDGTSWSLLGTGLDGEIRTFATESDGTLVAGGDFTRAGGQFARGIARWDGTRWRPVGTGFRFAAAGQTASVLTVKALPGGNLLAGGSFDTAGSGTTALRCIARWDGTSWQPLGSGMELPGSTASVRGIVVMPNGDIIAGGNFIIAGTVAVGHIARWNGTQWSPVGVLNGPVNSLVLLPGGDLLASGGFGNSRYIKRWNGTAWVDVPGGSTVAGQPLTQLANGDVLAMPTFTTNSPATSAVIRRMTATGWETLTGPVTVQPQPPLQLIFGNLNTALELPGRGLLVAGTNFLIDGRPSDGVALWDGTRWSALGRGLASSLVSTAQSRPGTSATALALLPDGQLAVGTTAFLADGTASPYFSRYRFAPGAPIITQQPSATVGCRNRGVTLTTAATGAPDLAFQWRKGGVPIDGTLNPSALTPVLQLTRISAADAGIYDCLVTNPATCGGLATTTVQLSVRQGCSLADIAGNPASGSDCGDGTVDGSDFIAFINSFGIGDATVDPLADVAGGGDTGLDADGVIDGDDFIAFINAFAVGC